jgi:hypothetical protein
VSFEADSATRIHNKVSASVDLDAQLLYAIPSHRVHHSRPILKIITAAAHHCDHQVRGFAGWPGVVGTFFLEGQDEPVRLKLITTRLPQAPAQAPTEARPREAFLVGDAIRVVGVEVICARCFTL